MARQLPFDHDPWTGAVTTFEHDESENRIVFHKTCDVTEIIELNKTRQNDGTGGRTKDGHFWHAASIPIEVVEMWKIDYKCDPLRAENWPLLRRLLNDPENRHLRVADFRL